MSEIPTWDKITNAQGSTTTEFGGNWANLISDYYNGVNVGLTDPSKIPIIGTLTRYKFEKLGIFDTDQSHYVIFSADDIDTGVNRKIRFRRMNSPFEEDFAVLEGMPQTLLNKTMDFSLNSVTNIVNANISSSAAITDSKLSQITNKSKLPSSVVYNDQTNSFGDFDQVFKDNRIRINNPADTFSYTVIGAAIAANRNLTLPLLTGNDTVVTEAFAQTLTNKVIDADANTITNIENADIKSAAGIVYSKLSLANSIVNADIASGAAIVTTKLADSANFILKTLDNAFGAHYQDFTKMTAPANPSANDIRLYVDTADTHMKIRNSAGTIVDLHTGGGGGATNLDALTDVDLTTVAPVNGDVLTYTTTGTKWIPSAPPGAGGGITASSTDTLTNKSINADNNTITNIDNNEIKAAAGIVTSKLADSANFILKTLDNSFGAHYQDITKMTAPANPGANDIRLYVDTTDTHLKIRNNAGTVVDLHSAGNSYAPTSASYVTLGTDATLSSERVLTAGTNLSLSDGGAGSTITANVPDGSTTVKGAVEIATDGESSGSVVVAGNDSRLTAKSFLGSTPYLYTIFIDTADSNKYKAINHSTNAVTDSGSSTDVLSLFNTVVAACSTAKRPFRMDKGKFAFSAAPTIAAKWIHIVGTRTGGYAGGQGDYTNETVLKKAYTDNTNPFMNWDGSSGWTKQQWQDVTVEGKDSTDNGAGTFDDGGIGFQIKSTGTAISEIYDCFRNVIICHFNTGLKLMKCFQLTFHDLGVYKCSTKGIYLTDDGTTGQCFEILFRGGEVRLVPTNVHVEKATHTRFDNTLLEGDSTAPYAQVNSVKIDSGGHVTRVDKCTFETNTNGITTILDDGYGTVIDACRFGGSTWTAQTVYHSNVATKANFINNTIEPYANSAVATVLLASGSYHININGNHVAESATGTSLVITDNSTNTTTNTFITNSSGASMLTNYIGPNTSFLQPTTVEWTNSADVTDEMLLKLFRKQGNNAFRRCGITFDQQNDALARITYSKMYTSIEVKTAGAEESYYGFDYMIAGTLARRAYFYNNGAYIGPEGTKFILLNTSLTANRTYTFPDASGQISVLDATQTVTNKTMGNMKENWVGKSAAYTMTDADYGIYLTGTGTYSITLPAASGRAGKIYKFIKTGASGTVTIDPNASETVNGVTTLTITTQYQMVQLVCDGTAWFLHRMAP